MKQCTNCKATKPLAEFSNDKHRKDGLNLWCKSCQKAAASVYYVKNKVKQRRREYYQENFEEISKKQKEIRTRTRGWQFGLEPGAYEKLFTEQKGLCKICRKPETKKNQWGNVSLSVDHDHDTGKVRGLLCNRCNLGLGYFQDDTEALTSAVSYLRDHRAAETRL
jgi:hypothetical protein